MTVYLYGATFRTDVDLAEAVAAWQRTPFYLDGRPDVVPLPDGPCRVTVGDNLALTLFEGVAPALPYLEWYAPLSEPPPYDGVSPNGYPWVLLGRAECPEGTMPLVYGVRWGADGAIASIRGFAGGRHG